MDILFLIESSCDDMRLADEEEDGEITEDEEKGGGVLEALEEEEEGEGEGEGEGGGEEEEE